MIASSLGHILRACSRDLRTCTRHLQHTKQEIGYKNGLIDQILGLLFHRTFFF